MSTSFMKLIEKEKVQRKSETKDSLKPFSSNGIQTIVKVSSYDIFQIILFRVHFLKGY